MNVVVVNCCCRRSLVFLGEDQMRLSGVRAGEKEPLPAIFSKSSLRNSVHSASRHLFLYVTEEFNTKSSRHLKVACQSGGQNPTTEGPCLLRTQRQTTTMSARKDLARAGLLLLYALSIHRMVLGWARIYAQSLFTTWSRVARADRQQ